MKKILLITFIAVLAFNYQAKAQIGVKLGYNFANQSEMPVKTPVITNDFDKKTLNSISAGVFFDRDIIPLLDLRIGLEYSPKGSKIEKNGNEEKNKINYLEIPVLAKVKLGPVYGLGGFYGAYAINGKFSREYEAEVAQVLGVKTDSEDDIEFNDENLKRMDFGVKFGAGVQVGFGILHAFAQVEYSYGLSNISKVKEPITNKEISTHNSVLCASLGVILGL